MRQKMDLSEKQIPERLVYEFFNRVWCPPHELDAIDELMTEDYSIVTTGMVRNGRVEFKQWVGSIQKLLLDAEMKS